jgi:hypothetical protein
LPIRRLCDPCTGNGERLVSHFDTAEDHTVLARYDPTLQPLVQMLLAEKNGR